MAKPQNGAKGQARIKSTWERNVHHGTDDFLWQALQKGKKKDRRPKARHLGLQPCYPEKGKRKKIQPEKGRETGQRYPGIPAFPLQGNGRCSILFFFKICTSLGVFTVLALLRSGQCIEGPVDRMLRALKRECYGMILA